MSLFNLISNTIEGVAETTVNTAKLAVSPLVAPLDNGKTAGDAAEGIVKGIEKIGKSDDE